MRRNNAYAKQDGEYNMQRGDCVAVNTAAEGKLSMNVPVSIFN
jgi:hypothetical protein